MLVINLYILKNDLIPVKIESLLPVPLSTLLAPCWDQDVSEAPSPLHSGQHPVKRLTPK